jgi:manganese/zinc/iron transport system permease protein
MDLAGFGVDHTLQVVAAGSAILGATSGALGSFAVLRRQSLLGDALSHAALPGIALAFLVTGTRASLPLLVGAALAGWLATVVVGQIVRRSRIPYDAALGLVLAVFFGLGLVLLTHIQKLPNAAQAGLDSFLFGQAAALLTGDVAVTAGLAVASLVLLILFWKELKLLAFDPDFGAALGLKMARADALLVGLLVVAVVVGLQTVGVVLMSAMLVAPGAAARQWSDRLGPMVVVAAAIGGASGAVGAVLSSLVPHLPTGPTIVLALTTVVVVSVVAAPRRGLLWRVVRVGALRAAPPLDPVLMHLYALSLQHLDDPEHGHDVAVLRTMSPAGADLPTVLARLEAQGLARQVGSALWAPTAIGRREARRIWERQEGGGG